MKNLYEKNCKNCKNAQLYKCYYDNCLTISCNEKITKKINKLTNDELLHCIKNGLCYFYENGKPNENIIVSYDD